MGLRALHDEHEHTHAAETIEALQRFLASQTDVDWDIQARTRPLAEESIERLRDRLDRPAAGASA